MTEIKAKVVKYDLRPHPNADVLSVAMVQGTGWQCIVKTDDAKDSDLGVYIPIDAEVDATMPEFTFLAPLAKNGKCRIKTIRLRGMISQGLLLPAPKDAKLGDDLTEALKVTRWEPPVNVHFAGDQIREPGVFARYTSITNIKYALSMFQDGE
jgi:RNA ligase (TIGR02306 family)